MSQRSQVEMSPDEVAAFLTTSRKLQLATINKDGTPHLVTMFYAMQGNRLAFWTYRTSQKARNLARDPRVTCLIEDGEDYFELRGVQINGVVREISDIVGIAEIGREIAAGLSGVPTDALDEYVAHAARKRLGYVVEPIRITSWDHRKLVA